MIMSAATKRKHVTREVVEEFRLPQQDEQIVKVIAGRGNNLHEVADKNGQTFLVSMPTKFRKNVWIKRGDFVFISPIDEGDKVKGEISTVLYRDQIKYLKKEGAWPSEFDNSAAQSTVSPPTDQLSELSVQEEKESGEEESGEGEEEESDDNDLFQNTNRRVYDVSSEDSEESETD
eukprot:TRINITY_DN13777_c0_g1_i3.p2 TRINITY_DN13777_c0_g1~~TRINITY_DN13777_c0_g1_i3.p2  ORF type:complete len:176 (-),score=70.89 TRINITY_DN13777_c0_g1_i3:1845-2372(-)